MRSWPRRSLAEVAAVGSGAGFPIAEQGRSDGAFPFLKVSDMNLPGNGRTIESWNNMVTEEVRARLRATAFPAESVIFPKIGAAIGTNKKRLLTRPCCVDNNVMAVVPDLDHLEPHYLYYLLLTKNLSDFASDSNPPSIRKTVVEAWQIPVPPLDEQRRIVDLLSRAEGIVRLRRDAQKKAAEIIPALFLDMFGDPATNPKGWPLVPFGEVGSLDRGRSRHRPRDADELYGGRYPFIQTGDIANSGGRITRYSSTYSEVGLAQSKLWAKGTLCITIAANIAKTGVLDFDTCFPDSVVGFVPGKTVFTSYIQEWLSFLQPTLEASAPQAAQKNINLEILRSLPVPVPPLPLQGQFERHCEQLSAVQAQQVAASVKAVAAFNALLARAFEVKDQRLLPKQADASVVAA